MKSSTYLAQALLELQRPQEAYEVAIDAYRASIAAKSPQSENLSRIVLRSKQQIWAVRETARLREMSETLASVEQLIEADLEKQLAELQSKLDSGEIGQIGFNEDQKVLREEAEKNVMNVRNAFCIASNHQLQERVRTTSTTTPTYIATTSPRINQQNFNRLCQIISSTGSPSRLCMTL